MKTTTPAVFLAMVIAGCACGPTPDKMQTLGDQLRRLTAAVQGEVIADPAGTTGLPDRELLARATAHDPALLTPFADYSIKTSREANYVSVLVCTKDGKTGLLEDTNCTVPLDKELWRESPTPACQPTVQLVEVCK